MNLFDSPSHSKNTDGRKEKITNKGSISISRENNGGQKGENKEKAVIVAGDREVESVAESLGEVMISNTYEEGTIGTRRRLVNVGKFKVSFSRNVPEETKTSTCNKLGFKQVTNHSRYLGLPIDFVRSKKELFYFALDRVWKKLNGWKKKALSGAGGEVLIKVFAQVILSYIMSCYRFPEGCYQEIERMVARFSWGKKEAPVAKMGKVI
ncbi:hypothetical protein KIW84_013627 [Lathyrus oleraceus]|uniref:Uncharacterized protein n=1 Tax=Pisum sativum TaxID=3888 RepID=A0A9D5BKN8_PEA|nr:hypothetical protein KIW84_013627 [Pisum sativum]